MFYRQKFISKFTHSHTAVCINFNGTFYFLFPSTHDDDNNKHTTYRLDRKSSRGMIYENEELRLRTININAEVERGKQKTIHLGALFRNFSNFNLL